jgi:hypothetical protein
VALTEKIPAQNKIAELEGRVQQLEAQVKKLLADKQHYKHEYFRVVYGGKPTDSSHWKRAWEFFDLAFKEFDQGFREMFH